MSVSTEEIRDAENAVLSAVQTSAEPVVPLNLIEDLIAQKYREELVRYAIWYLIDRNKIELTRDLRLAPSSWESTAVEERHVGAGVGTSR